MKRKFEWNDGKEHYDTPNINYDHEACGLEKLAEFNDPNASYSFDDFLVFRDKETKEIYCASDSGCSCPTPFEGVRGLDDMNHCPDIVVLKRYFDEWNREYDGKHMANQIEAHMELERVFNAH